MELRPGMTVKAKIGNTTEYGTVTKVREGVVHINTLNGLIAVEADKVVPDESGLGSL